MGYNITAGQQAKLEYGMAQAEAVANQSQAKFETGTQALIDKGKIEQRQDSLRDRAAKAQKEAMDRQASGGKGKFWGNVVGTIAAVAIPGSSAYLKALKVLLPAIGGATGILASGALKDIEIKDLGGDLEDELVFGKKEGRKVDDVLDDLKRSVSSIDDQRREGYKVGLAKDVAAGIANLKYDNLKVTTTVDGETVSKTLGELREAGKAGTIDYTTKDYFKDIFNIGIGLDPKKTMEKIGSGSLSGVIGTVPAGATLPSKATGTVPTGATPPISNFPQRNNSLLNLTGSLGRGDFFNKTSLDSATKIIPGYNSVSLEMLKNTGLTDTQFNTFQQNKEDVWNFLDKKKSLSALSDFLNVLEFNPGGGGSL